MFSTTKNKSKGIVGLEIEAGSVAATEVSVNGSIEVTGYGVAPLDPGVFREGEVVDVEALAKALEKLFSEHKLSKNVRLGIANQKVVVRTLRMPAIDDDGELETAIRFQAVDQIPMPPEQAVMDWAVVGHHQGENGERMIDVVVVAARRDMLSALNLALTDAGLRPVGIDLSAFGMIRALSSMSASAANGAPAGATEGAVEGQPAVPATLYCNLGDVTNLAVGQGTDCRFTRISTFGVEGIAQKLAERRQLTLEHARQWLVHVGLETPVEEIEGDSMTVAATREVLVDGEQRLAEELRRSLEFYGHQEDALAIESVVVCGPGTVIPGLVGSLQRNLGLEFRLGKPAPLSHLDDVSTARLTLAYGLALEE